MVTGYRLQITGYRLPVTGYRLQVTLESLLWILDEKAFERLLSKGYFGKGYFGKVTLERLL